jgi:predicted transcriptional regulator
MLTNDGALLRILKSFKDRDSIGFSELAQDLDFGTDLTGYYLRKLQRKDLIEKTDRGMYRITPSGKSVLTHTLQLNGLTIIPRISLLFIIAVGDSYVLLERNKQPFIGKLEWPTRALEVGQVLEGAAEASLKERLGIEAPSTLKGFYRRIDTHDGIVFDDKLFAVHTLELSDTQAEQIKDENQMGTISVMNKSMLNTASNRSKALLDILAFASDPTIFYTEKIYSLSSFDFYNS